MYVLLGEGEPGFVRGIKACALPQSGTRHYSVLLQLERSRLGLETVPKGWAQGHRLPAIISCNPLEQLMPPRHHSVSWAAGFS